MLDLQGYGWQLAEGALLTLEVALASLVVAVTLGIVAALARLSHSRLASGTALAYATVIRGVPDLVLMLLLFYGGQELLNALTAGLGLAEPVQINPFVAGVLTLGFIYGAYMSETFRGAILAVPVGQLEAAHAFGMRKGQVFRRVLIPQMMRHALPGFGNNWLVLLKGTAIVSLINLNELVFRAAAAGRATRSAFTFLFVVLVIYLAFTTASELALGWAERRYNVGHRRA